MDRIVARLALALVNLLRWCILKWIKHEDEKVEPKPAPESEDILNPQDTM